MSREQKLSKKIAHTLLAMSIVYSGGMNVLCNTAFAAGKGADGADKKENVKVTDSFYTDTYTGNNGADGAVTSERTGDSGGNGGKTIISSPALKMYLIISVLLPPAGRAVLDNGLQKVVVKDMAAMAAPAVLQPSI